MPPNRGPSLDIFCLVEEGQEEEGWREDQSPNISSFRKTKKETLSLQLSKAKLHLDPITGRRDKVFPK